MSSYPLNVAPMHWRVSLEYEMAIDNQKHFFNTSNNEPVGDSKLRSQLLNSIHNLERKAGKSLEVSFQRETGKFVILEKNSIPAVEIIAGPFWAIGSDNFDEVPSHWKLSVYADLVQSVRRAWRLAANSFVKAAWLSKCVATGIRKNNLDGARVKIDQVAWRFEILTSTAPHPGQNSQGLFYSTSHHAPSSEKYFTGPKIDWANNSFVSLDGDEWTDVQVVNAGTPLSESNISQIKISNSTENNFNSDVFEKRRRGRKSYNWKEAQKFVWKLMDEYGDFVQEDPEWNCQARLETKIQQHFMATIGREIATSTVRKRLPSMVESWRENKKAEKAGKAEK